MLLKEWLHLGQKPDLIKKINIQPKKMRTQEIFWYDSDCSSSIERDCERLLIHRNFGLNILGCHFHEHSSLSFRRTKERKSQDAS